MLDTAVPSHVRAAQRLEDELIIWLTTVRSDGQPQTSPVWFVWDGQSFLIYSRPSTPKLANIQGNHRVSLNFDGNGTGGDIVIFEGSAARSDDPPANTIPDYLEKYRERIERLGTTPQGFADSYSVPIRVVPTRVRA
ncbi:MAG: TIGR03667 family PPOX class F420-dependent oxidoreductase [Actinomycetota bacterium]|nr:TIGR03667 family PPOX class F420-dependent oxidoreductase [Actinomycetota bacterium]